MDQILSKKEAPLMEVPPELRGMSDEDIIKNSEKTPRIFNGKKRNGSLRPSKRDREALKKQKELQEVEDIAAQIFKKAPSSSPFASKENLSSENHQMVQKAFTSESSSYSFYKSKDTAANRESPRSMISEPTKPASGRVLKVSFGAKTGEKPKSVIVSASDLAKQKAEERAKKIQDLFKAKHPEATTAPDGTPIKRGRGRPRKNPII